MEIPVGYSTLTWTTTIQNLKRLYLPYFLIKISSGYTFSYFLFYFLIWTRGTICYQNCLTLPIFFAFASDTSCSNQRKVNLKNIWWRHVRKRIDHWCSVSTGKAQPSGPPVQWETRQASFPTGTVDPRVGIFLSPLDTNDGFYLSHPGVVQVKCMPKNCTRSWKYQHFS